MAENKSSAPLKTAEGTATLWCVHLTGADDVHPMPSREVALEEANGLNTSICRIKRQDVDPVLIAVVAEWPHSADSHAAGLMIRDECLRMRATPELPATEDSSAGDTGDWAIDVSAGREILVYKNCSVIEAEQAHLVLSLIRQAEVQAEPVAWTDDQVIRFAWQVMLQGNTCDSIEVRLNNFRGHEALRGIPAPEAQPADALDAAFEAMRKRLCKLPRHSFHIDSRGNIRRVTESSGNWIEFASAHALFDPVALDAAMAAAQPGSDTADQGLPLLQDGQENGYGTCTIDATMPPAQEGGNAAKEV